MFAEIGKAGDIMAKKEEAYYCGPGGSHVFMVVAVLVAAGILGYAVLLAGEAMAAGAAAAMEPQQIEVSIGDVLAQPDEHTISVDGEAERKVAPDLLVISITVETEEDTADLAQSENAKIADDVRSALLALGMKEEKVKTSSYYVYPLEKGRWICPEGYPDCEDWEKEYVSDVYGWKVVHSLTVETEDLDSGGDLVDAAVDAGASDIDSVSFTLTDATKEELRKELLKEAGENAGEKAQAIADGVGVTLGSAIYADEGYMSYPSPRSYDYMAESAVGAAPAPSTDFSAGELTVSAQVSVKYLIE